MTTQRSILVIIGMIGFITNSIPVLAVFTQSSLNVIRDVDSQKLPTPLPLINGASVRAKRFVGDSTAYSREFLIIVRLRNADAVPVFYDGVFWNSRAAVRKYGNQIVKPSATLNVDKLKAGKAYYARYDLPNNVNVVMVLSIPASMRRQSAPQYEVAFNIAIGKPSK